MAGHILDLTQHQMLMLSEPRNAVAETASLAAVAQAWCLNKIPSYRNAMEDKRVENKRMEDKQSEDKRIKNSKVEIPPQDNPTLATTKALRERWKLFLVRDPINRTSATWNDMVVDVTSIHDVAQFWRIYDALLPPSKMDYIDYCIFQEGTRPAWEDPGVQKGGRWQMTLKRSTTWDDDLSTAVDELWLHMLLASVGATFGFSTEVVLGSASADKFPASQLSRALAASSAVCGCVVSSKPKTLRFALWLKSTEYATRIGRVLHALVAHYLPESRRPRLCFQRFDAGGRFELSTAINGEDDEGILVPIMHEQSKTPPAGAAQVESPTSFSPTPKAARHGYKAYTNGNPTRHSPSSALWYNVNSATPLDHIGERAASYSTAGSQQKAAVVRATLENAKAFFNAQQEQVLCSQQMQNKFGSNYRSADTREVRTLSAASTCSGSSHYLPKSFF